MITTNTGAKKMEGTDEWRQIVATSGGAHNDTVDAYDRHIEALQDSLGIVVDGKQAAVNAAIGQYVILRNSTIVDSGTDMLPDGLYTAAKAISANTDIDKTYLTAVSSGGLNSLNSNIATLVNDVYGKNALTMNVGTNKNYTAIINAIAAMSDHTIKPCYVNEISGSTYYSGFLFRNSSGYGGALLFHHSGTLGIVTVQNGVGGWKTFN